MKKISIAAAVFAVLGTTACKKDISGQAAGQVLGSGQWTVSYYYDKDHDETAHFSGYRFTFADDTVKATNGTQTVTGTYTDQGSDDSTPKFILQLNAGSPFDDLNDDWHVLEKTNTLVRLQDQSGSGEMESLNFSRQ